MAVEEAPDRSYSQDTAPGAGSGRASAWSPLELSWATAILESEEPTGLDVIDAERARLGPAGLGKAWSGEVRFGKATRGMDFSVSKAQ